MQTLVSRIQFLSGVWGRAIGVAALGAQIGIGGGGTAMASAPARPPTPPAWFHVFPIDEHTFAISEPKYWQENVSYLLIGTRRALLFDTGPGIYSIRAEVRRLTSLPVIAIPTHLHFDHVGDLEEFSDVRLLDKPALRAQVRGGYFVEPPSQYMLRGSIKYRVHGWIKDGEAIDLGGRTVRLLGTPGHTPDSVSLVDAGGERLFTGDLVNRVATLCAVPGSDVNEMADSLHRLLQFGNVHTRVYEAHAEAPLTWAEFEQLASGIADIAAGRQAASNQICLGGTPMRRFSVGPFPILLPLPGGAVQAPLASVTEAVDFEGGACSAGTSPFREPWIDGTSASEPEMQVQRFSADTYVIRQSIKTNVEGPFIFLFFGAQRALQIDTGAGGLKIRPTIDGIITQWVQEKGLQSIELVIAHSHAHDDHIAGDAEFADRPHTRIVGHAPAQVAEFFHIHSWPEDIEAFDLGGRVLDIIPSPGHEPAEIAVFDRETHLLLMGDELYPGRLYIPVGEFETYKKSIARVVKFTRTRDVSWILGNHIEMTRTPGRDYEFHAPSHPGERKLELPYARVLELLAAVDKMAGQPRLEVHHDFIIYPLP